MIPRLSLTLITILLPLLVQASTTDSSLQSLFDRISGRELLEIDITTDLEKLTTPRENTDYQPALITFQGVDGIPATWSMRVKARGRYRYRVCDFPPLKIDFEKDDLSDAGLAEYDDYKLVTHCMDDDEQARDNVLREYMAYRMYNVLTDQSFRVQLVRINYYDLSGNQPYGTNWGILIESTREMARRIGGEEVEVLNQPETAFDARAEHRMSYFQYLIGNSDYDLANARNIKFIKLASGGGLIPVPYDFDFSLLVNAPYAIPNNNVGQMNLQDRVYMGFERTADEVRYMEKFFESRRDDLEQVVRRTEALNRSNRLYVLRLLDTFYEEDWTARLYPDATPPVSTQVGK